VGAASSGLPAAKAARRRVPVHLHAGWEAPADRPDPIGLLEQQGLTRIGDLLPIRYGRMLSSPLAFFRGGAAIMSWDLARTPVSGFRAQLCGDAHLGNFGGFASTDRTLIFDINDFDETLPGPWEWDVKRLAASLEIAARDSGVTAGRRTKIVRAAAEAYRAAMREFGHIGLLDVWYRRLDVAAVVRAMSGALKPRHRRRLGVAPAGATDNQRVAEKHFEALNGHARFVSTPPLVERLTDLMPKDEADMFEQETRRYLDRYRSSLTDDRRRILDGYELRDVARKVVGVGSVGTRTQIALLVGHDNAQPLVLQMKEASRSVLEPFAGKSAYAYSGRRVVEGQRLMQASSDVLLGWVHGPGVDGVTRDYYVRQLWDWKVAPDIEAMSASSLRALGQAAGWTLARAHARSGDRVAIAAYLGKGKGFATSIEGFATRYADQNQLDYELLVAAVDRGRIVARPGV
jgi:uncharacterized protein (DUF2252 family)